MYFIIPGIIGYKQVYNNWLYSIPNQNYHFINYPYNILNSHNIYTKNTNIILSNYIVNYIFDICKSNSYKDIILIGHSYGSNIICMIYHQLNIQLKIINCCIKKCFLLFPFIHLNDNYIIYTQYLFFNRIYSMRIVFIIFIYLIYLLIHFLGTFLNMFKQIQLSHIFTISNIIYNIGNEKCDLNYKVINNNKNIFEIIYCNDYYFPLKILSKCIVKKHFIDTYHCFMFKSNKFNCINNIIWKQ